MLDIAVTGAAGRMGRNLIQACHENSNCQLGAAIEHESSPFVGHDAGEMAGIGKLDIELEDGETKTIGITRAHLEEPARKGLLLHDQILGVDALDRRAEHGSPLVAVLLADLFELVGFNRQLQRLVELLRPAEGDPAVVVGLRVHRVELEEVETALTNEQLLERREGYLSGAVDNNGQAFRLAQVQYDVGQTDLLSVLQMQSRWIGARVSLLNLKNQRLAQRINLHLALGGSFEAR